MYNLTLRLIPEADLDFVRAFYKDQIGTPGCTWDEHYPNEDILQLDHATGNLYGLYHDDKLIGAISVSVENHIGHLPCWIYTDNSKEIARVVISKAYQGRGFGTIMLTQLFDILRLQGIHTIHLLVSLDNIPAQKLYHKFNFENRGQYHLYEHDYFAMEMKL